MSASRLPLAASPRLRVFRHVLADRTNTVAAVLLALTATGATLAVPMVMRRIVEVFAGHRDVTGSVLLMTALAVGGAMAAALSAFFLARAGERTVLTVRQRITAHALRLPLPEARRAGAGELVARVTSDSAQLRAVVDIGVTQLPMACLTAAATLVVMGFLDWVLLLIVVGTFSVAALAIVVFVKGVRHSTATQQAALGDLAQRFTSALAALPTIKAHRAESQVASGIVRCAETAATAAVDAARRQAFVTPIMGLGQQFALVGVVMGSGIRLASGAIGVAEFAAFLLYLLQLVAPLSMLANGFARLQLGFAAGTRIEQTLATPTEDARTTPTEDARTTAAEDALATPTEDARTTAAEDALATPTEDARTTPTEDARTTAAEDARTTPTEDARTSAADPLRAGPSEPRADLRQAPHAVQFEEVRFSHSEDRPTLDGLSFTAPRRGITALVGSSGAGKTTALDLVEGFLLPQSGTVRVLGHDVAQWPLDRLRAQVAYLDQTFALVEGTVRENLELGRRTPVTDAHLYAVLASVALDRAVADLPQGLDTVLGRAEDLSGGQRQRLALARVLLSDASVVLLDEPSSQLDGVNEGRLRDVVDELARDRGVIMVAHRVSTIRQADHIVVIDEGRRLDAGTHDELLDRCRSYRELVGGQRPVERAGARR
ncbi:ABC transporter transmembrane domain-containing protein [Streptomyces sp. NPDC001508]|uniref:ABC transporter transmembrane domain-containing protein n=1 Tax=Streptomyces sp. NPDC001508 TaxID=3154656 RepID=UPI00331DFD02